MIEVDTFWISWIPRNVPGFGGVLLTHLIRNITPRISSAYIGLQAQSNSVPYI